VHIGVTLAVIVQSALAVPTQKEKKAAVDDQTNEVIKPEILNAESNPSLRYPVANFSGWSIYSTSYGWFDITRQGIKYTVVQPEQKSNESYESDLSQISEI